MSLREVYDRRRSAIRRCISLTAENVKVLKEERDLHLQDQANKNFKAEQKKVRRAGI